MLTSRSMLAALFAGMLISCCAALAQDYPSKPIRIFTPQAGASTDFTSRLIAQGTSATLGQRMVIEGRAIVGVEMVAQAAPDGYMLLHYTNPLWLMPLFQENVPWDALRDFAPITLTVSTPNLVTVHPSVPVKSIAELIAFAKARPGQLNYGSSSSGSANHVAAELFKSMAGVNIVRINYKGAAGAVNDIIAGQLHVMFPTAGSVMQHVRNGRLRALAVTSPQPSALVPGVPTVASAGLPGYESVSMSALFAPAKTPQAITARLHQEVTHALRNPDVKARLFDSGVEVVASSPEELVITIKAEMERMRKVIKAAGLHE
ncbi:MAG TPA: tripartite tricarboxylate transporter substrate binding protein [Burkholderiales bacterium]|nr:tripartite tricarboxylate transporter substrate binding protein [Burkholderiales bacterium]